MTATANQEEAFKDIDAAILVGSMPRKEGMERKDLLRANIKIFSAQGKALDKFAKKTVKVCAFWRNLVLLDTSLPIRFLLSTPPTLTDY